MYTTRRWRWSYDVPATIVGGLGDDVRDDSAHSLDALSDAPLLLHASMHDARVSPTVARLAARRVHCVAPLLGPLPAPPAGGWSEEDVEGGANFSACVPHRRLRAKADTPHTWLTLPAVLR